MQRNWLLWTYSVVRGKWNNEKANITDLNNNQF